MFNPRLRELRWDVALLEEYTVPSSRAGPKYRVTGQPPCPKPTCGSLLTPSPSPPEQLLPHQHRQGQGNADCKPLVLAHGEASI